MFHRTPIIELDKSAKQKNELKLGKLPKENYKSICKNTHL
jgi:hypothetical protein